jgi:hypothetical protein
MQKMEIPGLVTGIGLIIGTIVLLVPFASQVMTGMIGTRSNHDSSISELESLGLNTQNLNEFKDSYEIGNLVENLKQMLFQDYKSMPVFTD